MLVNCDIKLLRPNRNNLRLMCVLCYAYWWLFAHSLRSICYQKSVPLGTLQTKSALFPPNYLYFSKILVFSLTLMLWIQFRSAAVVTFSMLKFIFRKNGTIRTPNLAYVFLIWSIESQQIINILILYFQYFANQRKKNQATNNKHRHFQVQSNPWMQCIIRLLK